MKRVKKPVFFILLVLILALTCTAVFGVYTQNGDMKNTWIKGVGDIRWGIDIRGGVEATFSPADGVDATPEQLQAAKAIIELRMVSKSITDYELYTDEANDKIIVRFPWKSGESDFDPETAIEEISATALLTFREGMEYETVSYDETGEPIYRTPAGTTADVVILEGSDVVEATPYMHQDEITGEYGYAIALTLSDEGAVKFAEATERLVGKTISIWMDDVMISFPTVNTAITGGQATIQGSFTASEASELASTIQGGALPFALQTSNFSTINPTLGLRSLDAMLTAGIIAFVVIAILMLVVFRLPGFVAIISLMGQLAITFAAVSGYFPFVNSFTMTLPGIAGLILSIGVGVDANIITASRIKEELRSGKTLDGAVHRGCSNSLWSIIDGNITILIVALMLIGVFGPSNILSKIFGESTTGAIYSFGYTLLVGVIGNFVMGVFCARQMLKSLSGFKVFRNKWFFGGSEKYGKPFNFTFFAHRKTFFLISGCVLALGLIASVIVGPKLDIQFAGGAMIRYTVDGTVDSNEIAKQVKDVTGRDVSVTTAEAIGAEGYQVTLSFAGNEGVTLDEQTAIAETLSDAYADRTFSVTESSSVDPTMGARFFQKCLVCMLLTFAILLAYIALRFRNIGGIFAGVTAIVALLHDVFIVFFAFVLFGFSVNDVFIAVILTILGYSLNDTIVVYDRIRENRKLNPSKAPDALPGIMDKSLNQMVTRTVLTSVTTFLALLVIFIVAAVYGLTTVQTFALPMIVGVAVGCYTSLCIATPLYATWALKGAKKS